MVEARSITLRRQFRKELRIEIHILDKYPELDSAMGEKKQPFARLSPARIQVEYLELSSQCARTEECLARCAWMGIPLFEAGGADDRADYGGTLKGL